MKVIVFKFTRLIPDVNGELPNTSAERSHGTVSEFDSGGCQVLSLNSCARARSGCGALDRVLGKGTGASKIGNRSLTPSPLTPFADFFSRGAAESAEVGGLDCLRELRVSA